MGKTVYSLILSSEVVAAVDELAARQGYSRSALVNHILAEYAGAASPQRQASQILEALRQQAGNQGLRPQAASAGSLTLRTAMNYKYNPALSYTVALQDDAETLGRLRVSLRSQNSELLDYFNHFFQLWGVLESRYLESPPPETAADRQAKRYVRPLRRPPGTAGGEQLGAAIAAYIERLDLCLRTFMDNCENAAEAVSKTERIYLSHPQDGLGGFF
ncbi:ribbon-helix-helix domain-containing protein [Ruminococcaceae bacterium OttesenSCG-928-D13]|nr:ribbon-helix-helix domain-containing protein [Ruminococcaceae bacterium OttesenSCG-928-D13]